MNKQSDTMVLEASPPAPQGDFDAFLARMGDRDRQNIARHLLTCESEPTPDHAILWKRLACALAKLVSGTIKTSGQKAVQFYVVDGKYRLQVFALEELGNNAVVVYTPDVLDAAVQARILRGPCRREGDVNLFEICQEPGAMMTIEALTALGTVNAPDYYRHMLGWNRRALRIMVPVSASPAHIRAVESICALAAPRATRSEPEAAPTFKPTRSTRNRA